MLEWLQIQTIVDKLNGLEPDVNPDALADPWRTIYDRIVPDPESGDVDDQRWLQRTLWYATDGLGDHQQRDAMCTHILELLASDTRRFPSLAEIADTLPPVEWLWHQWIPRGLLSLLGAPPGAGKSLLALDLCRRIIDGDLFPDGTPIPNPQSNTLYVDAEAIPQLHSQRANAWHMDHNKLYLMLPKAYGMIDFGNPIDRDRLLQMMEAIHPELVIVDSLSTISTKGENNVEDVRLILGFLAHVARQYDAGVLLIHHLRKRARTPLMDLVTIDDFRGSSHIIAMSRCVLGLSIIQDQAEYNRDGPRRLEIVKTNLSKHPKPLGVQFEEFAPDQVRLHYTSDVPQPYRQPTQAEECEAWLLTLLDEIGEPLKPKEVTQLAKEAGFTKATLYRARRNLQGIIVDTSNKHDSNNHWTLAQDDEYEPDLEEDRE